MKELIKELLGSKLMCLAGKGIDKVIDEAMQIANNKILEYEIEECKRNMYVKTLLHRANPVKLLDIYQPLYIKPSKGLYSRRYKNQISTSSIKELFNNQQYIILQGSAGSGKSTIIKYLFLNSFETKFKIPIKIELRYLNDYTNNIIEYIKHKIFKFQQIASSDEIIERLMQSGNFVFFLDGYDEINSKKKSELTKDIDDLVKLYNKNHYILTSRPFTDIEMLPLFHSFDVCNLSDTEIAEFINKQLPEDHREFKNKMIEAISKQENQSYKSF